LIEHYDFTLPVAAGSVPLPENEPATRLPATDPAEHVLVVRAYDRYENVSAAKTVVR
jgi:hypothetical protein